MRIELLILIIVFLFSAILGCAPTIPKTKLANLFEKNFEGFKAPKVDEIKKGVSKDFPYTTFDEVWDSLITVLMQQGVNVRSSKDTGVIVTVTSLPVTFFVENGEVVTVYLNWMEDYYTRSEGSGMGVFAFYNGQAGQALKEGKYDRAGKYYKLALKEWEKKGEPDDPVVISCLKGYAALLRKMKRPEEADKMEDRAKKIRNKNTQAMAEIFFGKLATQLYSDQKWGYLYK